MVERVTPNANAGEEEDNLDSEAAKAAQKAAEDAGVVVQGETLEPSGETDKDETTDVPERPENVPEKFWDAEKGEVNTEALLKSYSELETSRSKPQDTPPEGEEASEGDPAEPAGADEAITAAEQEFAQNGELSQETYDALAKTGFPAEMVDRYIAGQQAIANDVTRQAHSLTDGKENYNAMLEWGKENLDATEIKAFDIQVADPEVREHAISTMYARYQKEADVEPNLIGGDNGVGDAGSYFRTSKEMQAAINSPEYKRDPNFQAEVQRKIDRSEKNGVRLFG